MAENLEENIIMFPRDRIKKILKQSDHNINENYIVQKEQENVVNFITENLSEAILGDFMMIGLNTTSDDFTKDFKEIFSSIHKCLAKQIIEKNIIPEQNDNEPEDEK